MNAIKTLLFITALSLSIQCDGQRLTIAKLPLNEFKGFSIIPKPYNEAMKNPLMGFTTNNISDHPWATLAHTYIPWNEIENDESDGIEKIKRYCDKRWAGIRGKNIKVIPRVYLHYSGDKKYWPKDMTADDYTSKQFQERVVRLIRRLGECWDNDPRVAFIEVGILGKWGEHHSPDVTPELQMIVAKAFGEAFKSKKVTVRHNWMEFLEQPFGEYWDSWAHYDQMWTHGNEIKKLNDKEERYKSTFIGGEVAYDWGNWEIQPGATPTASVAITAHRNFIINSIKWLHCTQLRWISGYNKSNPESISGAEEIQKAFGYRFVINEVKFSMDTLLRIALSVTNVGSAPFYYQWPVEISLLDPKTLKSVYKKIIANVDIRSWLPGENWTSPDFTQINRWQKYVPHKNWNDSGNSNWEIEPIANEIVGSFHLPLTQGTYILSVSILDPASNMPSVKFATSNYLNGAKHPVGLINVETKECRNLPSSFKFDNPRDDNSLSY